MGLPEILIQFLTHGTTAISRSARGIVTLILKDSTKTNFDTKVYTDVTEIDPADWTAENKDYITKAFIGTPSKVIVERVADNSEDYNAALDRLKNKKWNYGAIPGIVADEVVAVGAWVKAQWENNKKTFKMVLPNYTGDHESIINFCTEGIAVGSTTYTAAEYCARIAGIMAGLPFTRSSTYYSLPEVDSITESLDPDADIDAGKLILIDDGEKRKIARGVNSLTTTTATKGESFKKIKIVDAVCLVRDDIRNTFDESYVGDVVNSYDNKILFLAAVNAYFRELEKRDVLDPDYDNNASIDVEAQRNYLAGQGKDVSTMSEQQIKEANTGSKVFAAAFVKFLDAMEDLAFTIYM